MKQTIILVILIVLAGAGLWWVSQSESPQDTSPTPTQEPQTGSDESDEPQDTGTEDNTTDPEDSGEMSTDTSEEQNDTPSDGSENTATEKTVKYTASGFSPKQLEVTTGTTVTFVNESDSRMWVGVDEHPTHTQYDGTSRNQHCSNGASADVFDQCTTGDRYSFTFEKSGTWDYHNHVNAGHGGTIVVSQ